MSTNYSFSYSEINLDPKAKYDAKDLLDAGLLTIYRGKKSNTTIDFMVEPEIWDLVKGDRNELTEKIISWKIESKAINNELSWDLGIWRLCPTTKVYRHINYFRHAKKGEAFTIGSTREGEGINRHNSRDRKKASNLEILRLLHTGSRTGRLFCPKTGIEFKNETWFDPKTGIEKGYDTFDLHHWVTYNGESVHKMSRLLSPSGILLDYDLSEEKHKVKLIEIMSCLILNAAPHTICHKITEFSDLEFWLANGIELPWFIRCKENFDSICKEFKLDLDYDYFMYVQSLEWVEDNLNDITEFDPKSNRLELKELNYKSLEDQQKFMNRFKKPLVFRSTTGTTIGEIKEYSTTIDF